MYSRLLEQEDLLKTSGTVESLMFNQKQQTFFENVELIQNIQLLLGVKFHNILLRIVFELILCLVETKPSVIEQFRNLFTMDILLKIFEDY